MADTKISALTGYTTPISTDVVPIVDVTAVATKKITVSNLRTSMQSGLVETVRMVLDGGGAVIQTGTYLSMSVDYAGTITGVTVLADQSGSIVVDVKKCTYAGFPGSLASIVASAPPTLSSAQKSQDTTLTGWTTSVAAGDCIQISVTSATTVTRVALMLKIART